MQHHNHRFSRSNQIPHHLLLVHRHKGFLLVSDDHGVGGFPLGHVSRGQAEAAAVPPFFLRNGWEEKQHIAGAGIRIQQHLAVKSVFQAFIRGDGSLTLPAAAASAVVSQGNHIRRRTIQADAAHALQRKDAVVPKERHRFDGALVGQFPVLRRADLFFGPRRIHQRLVKQSQFKFDSQDAAHRFVQGFTGNFPTLYQFKQARGSVGQFQIHAGLQAHGQGVVVRSGHEMVIVDDFHGAIVTHHNALEAPLLFKDIRQEAGIGTAGDAVDGVVGAHHTQGAPFLHAGPEGLQVHFPHFPPGMKRCKGIVASFSVIVHKMLGSGHNTPILEGLHVGHTHTGVHEHILSVTFLAPSPALVPGDVDNRGIYLAHAHGAKLLGHHLAHPIIQLVVKGGGHGNALWEAGGIAPLRPVQGLAVLQHRNAPGIGLDGPLRILVDVPGHFGRVVGEAAVRKEVPHIADVADAVIPLVEELVHKQQLGTDLIHLILYGHPFQEVIHALFHREIRVLVGILFPMGSRTSHK